MFALQAKMDSEDKVRDVLQDHDKKLHTIESKYGVKLANHQTLLDDVLAQCRGFKKLHEEAKYQRTAF